MGSRRLFSAMLLLSCAVTRGISLQNTDPQGLDVFMVVGSSVDLPGVYIDKETVYDLKKERQLIVVMADGHPIVRQPYTQRATFFPNNGSFFLRNLTKLDSGTYTHWVNMSVKSVINLHVMEEVTQPRLEKDEIRGFGACEVQIRCIALGEGPVNVTIFKDGKEVTANINGSRNHSTLTLHAGHPDTTERYTCRLSNPVSHKMSEEMKLPSVSGVMTLVVLVIVLRWCLSLTTHVIIPLREKRRREMKADEEQQAKPKDHQCLDTVWKVLPALSLADRFLGFLWEAAAALIFWIEHVFPAPGCYTVFGLAVCCVGFRIAAFWINIMARLTQGSDLLIVPVFYIIILSYGYSVAPCGLVPWSWFPLLTLTVSYVPLGAVLSCIFYRRRNKKRASNSNETQEVVPLTEKENSQPLQQEADRGIPDGDRAERVHVPECNAGDDMESPSTQHEEPHTTEDSTTKIPERPGEESPVDTDNRPEGFFPVSIEEKDMVCLRDSVANG